MDDFEKMPIIALKKGVKTRKFEPAHKLCDPNFIAKTILECLETDDLDACPELVDGYLMTHKGTC